MYKENIFKSYYHDIINYSNKSLKKKEHDKFNNFLDAQTTKYQKKYGFKTSKIKGHPYWNSEADAFKHTFGYELIR